MPGEPEVVRFYVEYWRLRQLYSLNKIYEEIKDDIGHFVNCIPWLRSQGWV